MQVSPSLTTLLPVSPPSREVPVDSSASRTDEILGAKENPQDRSWKKALLAMASLAASLGPQGAGAVPVQELAEAQSQPEAEAPTAAEEFKNKLESLKSIVPDQLTQEYKHDLGGWKFQFQGMDADLKPKLRLKGDSGLRLSGKFLETSLSQGEKVNETWSTSHGFRTGLRGEINTYEDPELDLYAQVYKRWNGRLGQNIKADFDASLGIRNRLIGSENEEGMSTGLSFRQKLEGKEKTLFGRAYEPFLDASQGAYRNLETNDTTLSYNLMVGAKHDIKVRAFGRDGKLTLTMGPEIKGRFTEHDSDPFDASFKTKLKARF